MQHVRLWFIQLVILACIPTLSFATDNYQSGVADKVPQEMEVPSEYKLDHVPEKNVKGYQEPKQKSPAQQQIIAKKLKAVSFKGATILDEEELEWITQPYIGKPFSNADLANLKYEVTKAYFEQGYIIVRVVSPPQDVADGTLQLVVYEAKAADHIINNNSTIATWVPRNVSRTIHENEVIREQAIESMISDINGLYGVQANLNLSPGKEVSTTDLTINVEPADENRYAISYNNYGSKFTGEHQILASVDYGNLLNLGELWSLDLRRSDGELSSAALGLDTPIGLRNIHFEGFYRYTENDIGDVLEPLSVRGKSSIGDVAFSKKWKNTSKSQISSKLGMEIREHETTIFGATESKDDIRRAYFKTDWLKRWTDKVLYSSIRVSRGADILSATQRGDALATRALGDPNAWIVSSALYGQMRLFNEGVLTLRADGQMASGTLLSSDLYTLGGYGSVRGFEVAQEAGEMGASYSAEYLHKLYDGSVASVSAGPFFDGGMVFGRVDGSIQDSHLYAGGLGVEITSSYLVPDKTTLRLDWAKTLGDYNATDIDGSTFYVKLVHDF